MPLTQSGPDWTDQTGASETITIQPVPPQTTTLVLFTAATYGTDDSGSSINLPGVAGTTALTFTVLPDFNRLLFGLASPTAQLQVVNIMQGATLLSTVSVQFHSGTGALRIVGTAADAEEDN